MGERESLAAVPFVLPGTRYFARTTPGTGLALSSLDRSSRAGRQSCPTPVISSSASSPIVTPAADIIVSLCGDERLRDVGDGEARRLLGVPVSDSTGESDGIHGSRDYPAKATDFFGFFCFLSLLFDPGPLSPITRPPLRGRRGTPTCHRYPAPPGQAPQAPRVRAAPVAGDPSATAGTAPEPTPAHSRACGRGPDR